MDKLTARLKHYLENDKGICDCPECVARYGVTSIVVSPRTWASLAKQSKGPKPAPGNNASTFHDLIRKLYDDVERMKRAGKNQLWDGE